MESSGNYDFSQNGTDRPLRIMLVDDHTMLLEGINNLLEREKGLKILARAESAEEAVHLLGQTVVDLVITDLHMPGMDGASLFTYIRKNYASVKTIVLSMHDEVHIVKDLLRAGVNGYVLKKDTHKELLNAIEEVRNNRVYVSSEVNKVLVEDAKGEKDKSLLTTREVEIVKLIVKELSNKQIAEALFISERTVETHRKNILRKTGVGSVVGLIKYAYANKIA